MKPIPEILTSILIRFWSKVDQCSDSECWNWVDAISKNYGYFGINSNVYLAHRISYYIHYKEDPGELLVCHECNNKLCVNPHHLFLGTNQENIQHSFDSGISSHRGILHPKAILTNADIREIRKLEGTMTQTKIGKLFGVSRGAITGILTGRKWGHIKS